MKSVKFHRGISPPGNLETLSKAKERDAQETISKSVSIIKKCGESTINEIKKLHKSLFKANLEKKP